MPRLKSILLLVLLSGISVSLQAEVYKWVDSKGVTHYGSKPPRHAKSEKIITPKTDLKAKTTSTRIKSKPSAARARQRSNYTSNEITDSLVKGR